MKASGASSPARKSDDRFSSATRPEQYRLGGPTVRLDPRVHAVRRDIADIALADRVFAPHYALPLDHGCLRSRVSLRAAPSETATAVSELLLGETFAVVDSAGGWAWGFCRADGYVGYVPVDAIGPVVAASHVVTSAAALVFAETDIKSPVLRRLPMGARIVASGENATFLATPDGFVHRRHVSPLPGGVRDPLTVAERLIGTPYRWGGRSGDGIDCSGLVQLAFALGGVSVPRDSDQQRDAIGVPVPAGAPLRRGDLVFLPGHVGLMANADTIVHANAWWMATVSEPLADMLARQPDPGVVTVRRP